MHRFHPSSNRLLNISLVGCESAQFAKSIRMKRTRTQSNVNAINSFLSSSYWHKLLRLTIRRNETIDYVNENIKVYLMVQYRTTIEDYSLLIALERIHYG